MGDDKTDAAELKRQVEESNKKLTTIQDQLKQLTELLNGKRDAGGFPLPSDPGLVADMRNLKDRLTRIEEDLNRLKTQTTLRPPTGGEPSACPCMTTEGPRGAQFFSPGTTGPGGAMPNPSASVKAVIVRNRSALRRLYSASRSSHRF